MANTSRHNRYQPRSGHLRHTVDSHLELALEHLPDFLLRMEMLVDGGAAREIVVRERHILRVEIASLPTRQALNDRKSAGIHDRHRNLNRHECLFYCAPECCDVFPVTGTYY